MAILKVSKLIIHVLYVMTCIVKSKSVNFVNISNIVELKAMEPISLYIPNNDVKCSISEYIDLITDETYYWITSFKPKNVIANIYDSQLIQYHNPSNDALTNSLPFNVGGNEPDPLQIGQCKSPVNNDIIICYNGGNTSYINIYGKYIYCAIFHHNNSTITSKFVVNNPNIEGLNFVAFPQVLCKETGYIVLYTRYIDSANNISYTTLDIDGNILSKETTLQTKQLPNEQLYFQITTFNDSVFLLTMAYDGYYGPIGPVGWIGSDNNTFPIQIMSSSSFNLIDSPYPYLDYFSTSVRITDDCCFITVYTTDFTINKNALYAAVADIEGNRVLTNDIEVSVTADAYFCGAIELEMLNKEISSNSKYFLIYVSSDENLYGYVYELSYFENDYQLTIINDTVLQTSKNNYYKQVCFSNSNEQLFAATVVGNPPDGIDLAMYGQSWNVTLS